MEEENVIVNGNSHEPEIDESSKEKILKPRKSVGEKEVVEAIENGSSENGLEPKVENGHDEELAEQNEKSQPSKSRTARTSSASSKKESTPKLESPVKRELRPRESTPKPDTPIKRKARSTRTPIKSSLTEEKKDIENKDIKCEDENDKKEEINGSRAEDSSVIFEGVASKDDSVVIIENSSEEIPQPKQSSGYFSIFRKSFTSNTTPKASPDPKDKHGSISSPICLDTPPVQQKYTPSSDVKGRKPIDPFFRFSGSRSFSSNSSEKRKAEDSFNGDENTRKRFAGETESGSEQSPGWSFISPFGKKWSPRQNRTATPFPSSTPFGKRTTDQDSMAVNFGDETALSLEESSVSNQENVAPSSIMRNICSIM